jgi:spermidine synthase
LEYSYKDVLFAKQSAFQYVEIVDTIDYGKLLILDNMANLAESDTVGYTHAIMNLPHQDYKVLTFLAYNFNISVTL